MNSSRIGLITLALFCAGCNREVAPANASAPAPAAEPVPAVASAKPFFVASGPVVVEDQVDVQALRDGVVVTVLAQPGTHVHKGQLLATLDDRQISADLAAAAARVRAVQANIQNWQAEDKVLQADYGRSQKLYEASIISKEEVDHARYKQEAEDFEIKRETETLNNAEEVEKSLELEREKTRILAPFDGVIARRYVRDGQKVAVGDRLFWVTALGPLEVKFTLPERFVSSIRVGEQLSLTSDDLPASQYTVKIAQVSPVVDPSSGTIEVLGQIPGSAAGLRPGMLVNVSVPEAAAAQP